MRALDLFCGAGGVSVGLQRAGFDVTGVDIKPQPNHRGGTFVQADALEYPIDGFDFIWASPPCQAFTQMSARWRGSGGRADEHPDLLSPTLDRLRAHGGVWCVENVPGAVRHMSVSLRLHGGMFGLGVHRPRIFESSHLIPAIDAGVVADPIGVYGRHHDGRLLWRRSNGTEQRAASSLEQAQDAMGIDWMTWDELRESIPPAYAEYIGRHAIQAISTRIPR